MSNFSVHCALCHLKAKIRRGYAYMQCMCDEEARIYSLENIKSLRVTNGAYLLENTSSQYYATKNEQ